MKPIKLLISLFLFISINSYAQYSDILNFTGTSNGATPYANVVISGSTMYGMTSAGGLNGVGCIFSVGTNGGSFTDLHDFTTMTGKTPHGSLILSGSTLYGMTELGGSSSDGVIFSIATNGSSYTVLHNFNGTAGSHPMGSLILSGSTLYGLATSGGANSDGCAFSITTSGASYTDIHDFNGTAGSNPEGSLLLSGSTLYGTALTGGANSDGVIFSMTTSGGSYTDMHDFNSTVGKSPHGSLILSGSTLYGLATGGGANSDGCIFSITTSGGSYTDLYDFTGTTGGKPFGDLLLSNNVFFGLTDKGGANGWGALFSVHNDGTEYADLHDFDSTHGSTPLGSTVLSSGVLYGMTSGGGSSSDGVIFNYTICNIAPSTSVMSNDFCHGGSTGSVSASATGGGSPPYTYSWAPGSQTTATITGLTAGTYTVTVTDFYSCSATATATITQPTSLSVTASAKTAAICPGSSDSLFSTPSGGTSPYTYAWIPFEYSDMSCSTCQKTQCYPFGTTYTVTVTDNNGCTATASVSITVRPFPYVTISGPINPIASGRSDTLVASAVGATYLWSNSSTTSSIIVSPSVTTTYSVTATNTYGCYDTAHYTVDTNTIGTGRSSSSPIRIVPSSSVTTQSFSTLDSVVWFSFVPTDSNNQIIANSAFLGYPVPHVHRLTLFNSSLNSIVDEPMPDIQGANQIRIDISHLHPGSTYYVRASRSPAHSNMAGCNPTGDVCNASQRWSFQMAFRTVPVFVPKDSGSESPAMNQLYYESRGQIRDLNSIPRFDIKAYTNNAKPAVYCSDSAVSFVYAHVDTSRTFIDSLQRVDMELTGTAVQPSQPVFKMEEDSGAGYLNYLLGFVQNGVAKVEGYSRLVYKNVYNNVDMHVYSNSVGTKLYFVCNPSGTGGAAGNPANIQLKFKGANSVTINADSGINVVTDLGTLTFAPGYAYEDSSGIIVPTHWHANFEAVNSNTVKFHTGTYNTNEPLIIEVNRGHKTVPGIPTGIQWCTFYGGTQGDWFNGVTTDNSNNVYTTGFTQSYDFPVLNGFQSGLGIGATFNAVMAKFAATTHARDWATYYGGDNQDMGNSIVVDASQNVYITGYTNSVNFPLATPIGAYQQPGGLNGMGFGPDYDAFIVKMKPDGTVPIWATFYGGLNDGGFDGEVGNAIVLDGLGNLYVAGGYTKAYQFAEITTYNETGAFNSTAGTGWILKFTTSGIQKWATSIGYSNPSGSLTSLFGAAVDASNNLYVTGQATESGYPLLSPGANATYNGGPNLFDAVVTKFDVNNAMVWSTYYGGDGDDNSYSITTDQAGNAYITGTTTSPNSSISLLSATGPYNQSYGSTTGSGINNAFIAEFAPAGTLLWSTYFGVNNDLQGKAITFDNNNGDLFVTGYSFGFGTAMPLPVTNPAGVYSQRTPNGSNGFIASFNRWGYLWGTYFGGTGFDESVSIATDGNNNLYIDGNTSSAALNFPLADQSGSFYQGTNNGAGDAFIADLDLTHLTGINSITNSDENIAVYPNPTTQNIIVDFNLLESGNVEFTLYNLLGQSVYADRIDEKSGIINQQINLSLLPEGTYILRVIAGNNIYHQKIIKLQ